MHNNYLTILNNFIHSSNRLVILLAGNILNSDDGLAVKLYNDYLKDLKFKDCFIINSELMPENYIKSINDFNASHLIFIDAIQVGGVPGEIHLFSISDVTSNQSFSTHSISFFKLLQTFITHEIHFLGVGIQIYSSEFGLNNIHYAIKSSIKFIGELLVIELNKHFK